MVAVLQGRSILPKVLSLWFREAAGRNMAMQGMLYRLRDTAHEAAKEAQYLVSYDLSYILALLSPLPSMIKSVADIDAASDAVLRAYLKAEKVKFSEEALRPELISDARAHFTTKNAKEQEKEQVLPTPPAEEPKEALPDDASIEEGLRQLHAKGFKDREELIAYLGAVDREKAFVVAERKGLQTTIEEIQVFELKLREREHSLEETAKRVHADMDKQAQLYDKLESLRASFPSGANLNV